MFSRFARFLALAFTAAAIPTSTAVAMPAGPAFSGSATTTGSTVQVTHLNRGDFARSDAAQRQATTSATAPDRSDAAQISKADLVVLHGRPVVPSHIGTTPSHVTGSSDGFDWSLAGMTALIVLAAGGAAVALRPRRVAT